MNNRWQIISELFDKLLPLPPKERAAFLANNEYSKDIQQEVTKMLDSITQSTGQFTAALEGVASCLIDNMETLNPGEILGSYQVVDTISRGGMGTVYRAKHHHQDIQQEVAIKLTQYHFTDHQMKMRFYTERKILSQLSHRYIAKLFDVGETGNGHPYMIMEYIDGLPITEYCDQYQLSLSARLKLFLNVCDAMQYAHQHGIIHRDLKPPNILVSDREGRPVAKLIDFGIAFNEEVVTTSTKTETIGTPVYMSPEQFAKSEAVDTRTDIYSLGVVLYELLGGVLPYAEDIISSGDLSEEKQSILPKLSTRLKNLSDTQPSVTENLAKQRQLSFKKLQSQLIYELDWILSKATHHLVEKRYQAIGELRQDIANFLNKKPVEAKPTSLTYRAKKIIQRYPITTSSVIALTTAILIATLTTSIALVKQQQAQALALAEKRQTDAINQFMEEMLRSASNSTEGINTRVIDQLDSAVQKANQKLVDSPLVKASVLSSIAMSYSSYNRFPEALALFNETLALRKQYLGEGHEKTLLVYKELGRLAYRRKEPEKARQIYEENAVRIQKYLGNRNTLYTANLVNLTGTYNRLAFYNRDNQAQYDSFLTLAEQTAVAVLERLKSMEGGNINVQEVEEQRLFAKNSLANTYRHQKKFRLAEQLFFEMAEQAKKQYGPYHLNYLVPLTNLSYTKKDLEDYTSAERLMREVVEAYTKVRGSDHRITLEKIIALGAFLTLQKKYDEAEKYLNDAIKGLTALNLPNAKLSKLPRAHYWLEAIHKERQSQVTN